MGPFTNLLSLVRFDTKLCFSVFLYICASALRRTALIGLYVLSRMWQHYFWTSCLRNINILRKTAFLKLNNLKNLFWGGVGVGSLNWYECEILWVTFVYKKEQLCLIVYSDIYYYGKCLFFCDKIRTFSLFGDRN